MAGTGIAYPADAVTGSPQFAATQGRGAFAATMSGATATRPLGGLTGVRPGTPASTVTATSTTWTAAPFGGYVDTHASATNGGYFFAFNTTTSGSITAAGGTARTDLVYVQPMDSNTSDGSTGAPRVVIDYISNYPTNALPARAFAIAQINVPASGGGSPTVTWLAPVTAAAGGQRIFEILTQLNAQTTGNKVGDLASVNNDGTATNNGQYRWNGSAWKPWESDWITSTAGITSAGGTITSGSASIRYRYVAGAIDYVVTVTVATVGTGTGAINVPLPFTPSGVSVAVGRENAQLGYTVAGQVSGSALGIVRYDNNSILTANGLSMVLNGTAVAP